MMKELPFYTRWARVVLGTPLEELPFYKEIVYCDECGQPARKAPNGYSESRTIPPPGWATIRITKTFWDDQKDAENEALFGGFSGVTTHEGLFCPVCLAQYATVVLMRHVRREESK